MSTSAGIWAEWLSGLRFEDLPDDVVWRMKRSILDALGGALVGSREPASHAAVEYVQTRSGRQESTIFPQGIRCSSEDAAIVFGTYVQAGDLAESFTRASMLVGNTVVPPAIAQSEKLATSGKDLITAMAGGFEIAIRCGLAVRVDPSSSTFASRPYSGMTSNGLSFVHPVATVGVYGAAAAAAKLLGLDATQAKNAFTVASSMWPVIGTAARAASSGAGMAEEGSVKDLFVGFSNAHGIAAAELARLGVTGPEDIREHFFSIVDSYSPDLLTRGLGSEYLVSTGGLHFKVHKAAGIPQSAAAAVLELVTAHPIDVDDIAGITVATNRRGPRQCQDPDPHDNVAAKLSIPYVVSAILCFADDVARDPHLVDLYSEDKFADARRRDLARKVTVVADEDFERGFEIEWPMRFPARVVVTLRSGAELSHEVDIWQHGPRLSDAQVIEKFTNLASMVLPERQVQEIPELVFALDDGVTIGEVISAACWKN